MAKGRTPAAPSLKVLKGTRADRIPAPGHESAGPCPDCPMPLDEVGRAAWDRFAPMLAEAGRLTDLDALTFALWCDAFSRYTRANAELAEFGVVLNTDLGGTKANPAAAVVKEASATMGRIGAEFGLSPASRLRLGIADRIAEADPLELFLAKVGS